MSVLFKQKQKSQFCNRKSNSTPGVSTASVNFKLLLLFVKLVRVINLYENFAAIMNMPSSMSIK